MPDWNSDLYLKYERERTQAARDLLGRLPALTPRSIVDLGCGPGNSTALLLLHFLGASILGLDNSDNMLAAARMRAADLRLPATMITSATVTRGNQRRSGQRCILEWSRQRCRLHAGRVRGQEAARRVLRDVAEGRQESDCKKGDHDPGEDDEEPVPDGEAPEAPEEVTH